jgi:hypothetical protein
MENLLSVAFDHLSSYDGAKIRKGLRQVEGLLATICLSKRDKDENGRASSEQHDGPQSRPPQPKNLAEISEDPAFEQFFKLQEGFEWNVAVRLVNTLDRLLAKGNDGQNDLLILSALDLIQGVLLLHPPSKILFSREINMNVRLQISVFAFTETETSSPTNTESFSLPCRCSSTSSSPTSRRPSWARRC